MKKLGAIWLVEEVPSASWPLMAASNQRGMVCSSTKCSAVEEVRDKFERLEKTGEWLELVEELTGSYVR